MIRNHLSFFALCAALILSAASCKKEPIPETVPETASEENGFNIGFGYVGGYSSGNVEYQVCQEP